MRKKYNKGSTAEKDDPIGRFLKSKLPIIGIFGFSGKSL
jgi:hypothetical protein